MVEAHQFDGLVLLTNCDKITPGMIMAAARLNVPSIVVTAGPMMAGDCSCLEESLMKVSEVFRSEGKSDQAKAAERLAHGHVIYGDGYYGGGWRKKGLLNDEELTELEMAACPGSAPVRACIRLTPWVV